MLDNLQSGIIICSNDYKQQILEKETKIFQKYKFLTLQELKENIFFSISKKAIYLLSKHFQIRPEIASSYLNSLYYTFPDTTEKFERLNKIKDFLKKEGALKDNPNFLNFIKDKTITFVGYPLTKELEWLKGICAKVGNVIVLESPKEERRELELHYFLTIEEEIYSVCSRINQLLNQGVSPSNIKITNYKEEYWFYLKLYGDFFNLPIHLQDRKGILTKEVTQKFLELCQTASSFSEIILELKQNNSSKNVLNSIIRILNDYEAYTILPADMIDILIMEFKKIRVEEENIIEGIEIVDFNSLEDSEDYLFLLSFDQNTMPYRRMDNDFLTDKEKKMIGIDTSIELNRIEKERTITKLYRLSNLWISFKERTPFNVYLPSNLVLELGMHKIKEKPMEGECRKIDDIKLAISLDYYQKYHVMDERIEKNYYQGFPYLDYNNQFSGIEKEIYRSYLTFPLQLSYTSVKTFYQCPFQYYLKYVLKIDSFTSSLQTDIGTYAHRILEQSYKPDFNYEEVAQKPLDLSKKEAFYFQQMDEVVLKALEFNKYHESQSKLNQSLCEQNITINVLQDQLVFTGYIDKIKYANIDGENVVAIIDYKTGKDMASLDNVADGFNLQLPIYVYLVEKGKLLENPQFAGFYLQRVNINNYKYVKQNSLQEQEIDTFKLDGYSSNIHKRIMAFDNEYQKSQYIAKLKVKNDGEFYSSSNIITDNQIQELIVMVEELIKSAYNKICEADFIIAPKSIQNTNKSCQYCAFEDVCYKTFKDVIHLDKNNFIGGEKDGLD